MDGRSAEGWDTDKVTQYLRGSEGSSVVVEVGRPRAGAGHTGEAIAAAPAVARPVERWVQPQPDQIPGVAGARYESADLERMRFRWAQGWAVAMEGLMCTGSSPTEPLIKSGGPGVVCCSRVHGLQGLGQGQAPVHANPPQ